MMITVRAATTLTPTGIDELLPANWAPPAPLEVSASRRELALA